MSAEELKRFAKDLEANQDLKDEAQKAGSDADAIVKLAQSKGYDISKDDLEQAKSGELSDTDLEKAAGGGTIIHPGYFVTD